MKGLLMQRVTKRGRELSDIIVIYFIISCVLLTER